MSHRPNNVLSYDHLAADYASHRRVHPGVFRALVEHGPIGAHARVLEVGCGTGNYSHRLAQETSCSTVGIDPSAQMLARARERGGPSLFQLGRAEQLPFPAASFDLLFSVDVIHHVGDRAAYVAEAHRVLASGGRLCTVTDSEEMIYRRRPLSNYFPETIPHELRRYPSIELLRAEMAAAGLRQIQEEAVEFHYLLTSAQAYRDKAFSSLHLIDADAFQRGLERLEADLATGPVSCVSLYTLLWGEKP